MSERMKTYPADEEQPKKEQTLFEKIDAVLRDKDTAFAKLLEAISPEKGEEYLNSNLKRLLDLSIAVPAAIVATPVIAILGIAKKLEDGGTAFFVQERYQKISSDADGKEETFKIFKIRSMVEGAERDVDSVAQKGVAESSDPRQTKLGKVLRKYKLDELPQLYQVVSGQLSSIGVRPLPPATVKRLSGSPEEKEPSKLFNEWGLAYGAGRKGLTGLQQVRGIGRRIPGERLHYDIFYTKNASLGLDLYLLWATLGRILGAYPRRKSRAKEIKE